MRIVNVSPVPYVFYYASTSKGGRRLAPGEYSPVLPFDRLVLPDVWRDLRSGKIQIKLDKSDKDFIQDILAHDAKDVVVKPQPQRQVPPAPPVQKKAEVVPARPAPDQQQLGKMLNPDAVHRSPPLRTDFHAHDVISRQVSIKDLMLQNEAETPKQSKLMAKKPGVVDIEQVGAKLSPAEAKKRLDDIHSFVGGRV